MERILLPTLVLLPLAVATMAALVRGRARNGIVLAGSVLVFVSGIACAVLSYRAGHVLTIEIGGWQPPLGIRLYLDGLSALLVATTAVIGLAISLYAHAYFQDDDSKRDAFWPLWLFTWGALNALFLSGDAFNLYVALELINLSAVALVALPRTAEALRAALRYLMIAFLGSLSYLFGVAWLYAKTGMLDIQMLAETSPGGGAYALAVGLMLVGLMIKAALFPMHVWLPPAHSSAPTPVSALLSGLVVTASGYIVIRYAFTLFDPLLEPPLAGIIGILGAAAVIWGSLNALVQARVKMVIAYSTVAQFGYLFLVFPLAAAGPDAARLAWYGGIYFAVCHACAKSAAFLAAGALIRSKGHDRVEGLAGSAQALPVVLFSFGLAGVNLIGLPPTGGFTAKWLLLQSATGTGNWALALVIVAGSLLAAAYLFRIIDRSLLSEENEAPSAGVPRWMRWSALGLAIIPLLLGIGSHIPLALLEIGSPVGGLP